MRAYHIARHLSRNHDLTLACLADEPRQGGAAAALRDDIPDTMIVRIRRTPSRARALLRLLAGGCATVAYFDSPELRACVARRCQGTRFDLVYVSSSSMAQYLVEVAPTPVVMDFVDVDSEKWLQYGARLPRYKAWVYRLEGSRLRQREIAVASHAQRCVVATRQEATLLNSLTRAACVTVIPNGVDLDYFMPPADAIQSTTIVFTGVMDYLPNVDAVIYFCENIFPLIRALSPQAAFSIVGKNPCAAVRRLAAMPGVHVVGAVVDVRPYLRQAAIAVAPLRIARGVQNKILEAMAMGLPVVATSNAHRGLDAEHGRHLFVEDTPRAFAATVADLLARADRRRHVGRAARAFVEAHHSWRGSMRQLDGVLTSLMRPRSLAVDAVFGPGSAW